jgi:hypothetical protein
MSKTVLKISVAEFNQMQTSDCAARPAGFTGTVWRFLADGQWHAVCASANGLSFALLKIVKHRTRISKPSRKR